MRCTLVFAAMAVFLWKSSSATSHENAYCLDLKPQHSLDLTQIMGMWYGVEKIWHMRHEIDFEYDTCPTMHLSEVTYENSRSSYTRDSYATVTPPTYIPPGGFGFDWHQGEHQGSNYRHTDTRSLRMLVDGSEGEKTYYLRFNNSRKGFWMYAGPTATSRGTLSKETYNHFSGTVQVIKAVSDHLVLTFCHRYPRSEVYSMILSREPLQLGRQEIHSIHNLLSRRKLSTSEVREYCNGGNISVTISYSTLMIMLTLLFSVY